MVLVIVGETRGSHGSEDVDVGLVDSYQYFGGTYYLHFQG
jgi:hypothetical protein